MVVWGGCPKSRAIPYTPATVLKFLYATGALYSAVAIVVRLLLI